MITMMMNKIILMTNKVAVKFSEAAIADILFKKRILKIPKNSQENTCARFPFLNKVAGVSL